MINFTLTFEVNPHWPLSRMIVFSIQPMIGHNLAWNNICQWSRKFQSFNHDEWKWEDVLLLYMRWERGKNTNKWVCTIVTQKQQRRAPQKMVEAICHHEDKGVEEAWEYPTQQLRASKIWPSIAQTKSNGKRSPITRRRMIGRGLMQSKESYQRSNNKRACPKVETLISCSE